MGIDEVTKRAGMLLEDGQRPIAKVEQLGIERLVSLCTCEDPWRDVISCPSRARTSNKHLKLQQRISRMLPFN